MPIDQRVRGNSSVAEIAHRNVCDVRFQSSGSFCQCHKRSPDRKELMTIHELDTPVLLIDASVLHRNLRKMAAYCDRHKLALRPHIKTHKMPEIAKLQLQYGATGITVAKLGEADVMADAGIDDILRESTATLTLARFARLARVPTFCRHTMDTRSISLPAVFAVCEMPVAAARNQGGIRHRISPLWLANHGGVGA